MQYKKFGQKYVVKISKGEEIITELKKFCAETGVKAGSISGIGATNQLTVSLFDVAGKKFQPKEFKGDYEIAPLTGNITTLSDEVIIHIHINFSDHEYHSFGGHLNEAIISAACEIIVDSIDGKVERKFDEEIGLNLIDL